MDLGLQGKVALVTAASQGMGRATALSIAREGAKVAICARNQGPLDAAAEEIRKETNAEVLAVRADVSKAADIRAFVDAATAAWGGIDRLVVNAGGPPTGRLDALTEEQWTQAYELTFQSAVRLIRLCAPSMKSRGGGAVVAITSISVKQPVENLLLSNTMRAAVVGLVRTVSRELASDRIRVNAVAPGWIATDRLMDLMRGRAERESRKLESVVDESLREVPLGRFGEPGEVADLITFLLSERAAYITGNVIQIDGGLYRGLL
ncbi:MAG TPA: SDR family oxidoreductase [Thermoplasmata archaeon]